MHNPTPAVMAVLALIVPVALAQTSHGDPMNNIDALCYVNFADSNTKAIVCARTGASNVFAASSTSFLPGTTDSLCCKSDNICMLSNETTPEAACYDPNDKFASTGYDNGPCELNAAGNKCVWTGIHGGAVTFSTEGTTKYTSVKDGEGVIGGSNSAGSASWNRATFSVAAVATVFGMASVLWW